MRGKEEKELFKRTGIHADGIVGIVNSHYEDLLRKHVFGEIYFVNRNEEKRNYQAHYYLKKKHFLDISKN